GHQPIVVLKAVVLYGDVVLILGVVTGDVVNLRQPVAALIVSVFDVEFDRIGSRRAGIVARLARQTAAIVIFILDRGRDRLSRRGGFVRRIAAQHAHASPPPEGESN